MRHEPGGGGKYEPSVAGMTRVALDETVVAAAAAVDDATAAADGL